LLAGVAAEGVSVDTYLNRFDQVMEPGLKSVRERTGMAQF
jgi:hypothetical protein